MIECRLGSIDLADEQHVADVLGESARSFSAGRFELVGRLDLSSKRFHSGALVRNLGNDQWFVHLINLEQLARLAQSELIKAQAHEALADSRVDSLVKHTSIGVAAHIAFGPAGAPIIEVVSAALEKLISDYAPQAKHLAQDLSNSGVSPENRGNVRRAVTRVVEHSTLAQTPAIETLNGLVRSEKPFGLEIER